MVPARRAQLDDDQMGVNQSPRRTRSRIATITRSRTLEHVFYDPRSATNKADSARAAAQALTAQGEGAATIQRTGELILATRHGPAQTSGRAAARHDEYSGQVRAEYPRVADSDFARGRAAFMRRFLDQPAIFPHPDFSGYEAPARANIAREIGR